MGGYTGFILSRRSGGLSVRPSPILVRSITPLLMEEFPLNLNDTFTSTRGCAEPMFFPQHILPLLSLYNAQWLGYESLTALVLVCSKTISLMALKLIKIYNSCFAIKVIFFSIVSESLLRKTETATKSMPAKTTTKLATKSNYTFKSFNKIGTFHSK